MELVARPGQTLECHLLDVRRDIIKWFRTRSLNRIVKSSKLDVFVESLRLAGFLHDIGKGEISIQEALIKDEKPSKSHAALSLPFFIISSKKILKVDPFEDETIASICFALLSHHSVPHLNLERNITTKLNLNNISFHHDIFELLKNYNILITEIEIMEELKKWVEGNRNNVLDFQLSHTLSNKAIRELFVAAYDSLVKADWASASRTNLRIETIKPALYTKSRRLVDPLRSLVHSSVHRDVKFSDNILLEMPTGFGKTYIGTSYAFKTNRKRIIYTLPITTIIEDVYDRLSINLGKRNVDWYTSRQLAIKIDEDDNYDQKSYEDARYFNASCVVTTLDQILMAWLNFDRYPLKEYPLYNSCIVLDEPQLYSPFMLFLFAKLYPEYLNKINLIVMSATIPNFLRDALKGMTIEPFHKDVSNIFSRYNRTYLCLDTLGSPIMEAESLSAQVKEILRQACRDKKKVAIVVNTVHRAQKVFNLVSESKMRAKSFLFHARFALKDKRNKLAELKKLLNMPGPTIVISTQMIEAGVDVSFDIMLRELAPFDSIVQSAGRVNRYVESPEPCIIYIFGLRSETVLPYQKYQIDATLSILNDNWPKKQTSEFIYYERLQKYWQEMSNWILKDEVQAQQILKRRNELSPFGIKVSEDNVDLRNGYLTISAVPSVYIDTVLKLLKERENTKDLWQRKKLSAKVESYMVEVPYFAKATQFGNFHQYILPIDKERYPWLNILTLKYSSELGVLPMDDNII